MVGFEPTGMPILNRVRLPIAPHLYGVPIEARFDGEKEQSRSTAEERPALMKPVFLSRAKGTATLCDHTDLKRVRADNDIVDRDAEDSSQDDQVVQGGQGLAPLPLVDGLGIAEAEDSLQIPHSQSGLLPQTDDISSGRGHINDRPHVHLICAPFRPWAGSEPAQLALKL